MSDSFATARLFCLWDFQGKNTEWIAISFSRGSFQFKDRTHVSYSSCIVREILYRWATWKTSNSTSGYFSRGKKKILIWEDTWTPTQGFQSGSMVKKLPADTWDTKDMGSIPESGRSSGEGNVNPLQYSCLENSMDTEAAIHGVAISHYWACMHAHALLCWLKLYLQKRRHRSNLSIHWHMNKYRRCDICIQKDITQT